MITSTSHLFNVYQEFSDERIEQVRRWVPANEAFDAFRHYSSSPAALIGTTKRVMITDHDDCCNAEWIFGKGITYPTPADIEKSKS